MQKTKSICLQLICLFLTLGSFELLAQGGASVTVNLDGVTVLEVLKSIEKDTNLAFFYNNADVDVTKKVSVHLTNVPVSKVIGVILPGYECRFDNSKVMIVKSKGQVSSSVTKENVPVEISGIIKDSNGEPLTGASVLVLMGGKPYGAIADLDGKFSLVLPSAPQDENIVFSFTGFKDVTMPLGTKAFFQVSMHEDFQMLEKVIVVGYGTQRRSDVTGAIASVTSEQLNTTPTNSLGEMLRGAAAGAVGAMQFPGLFRSAPGGYEAAGTAKQGGCPHLHR